MTLRDCFPDQPVDIYLGARFRCDGADYLLARTREPCCLVPTVALVCLESGNDWKPGIRTSSNGPFTADQMQRAIGTGREKNHDMSAWVVLSPGGDCWK